MWPNLKHILRISGKSLTYRTLLKMAGRIAIVIIIVTAVSYYLMVGNLTELSLGQLEKYVLERGQREQSIFQLASDNHETLKQSILNALAEFGNQDSVEEFEHITVRSEDNITRHRPEVVDTTRQAGIYIHQAVNIDADIRRRVLTFFRFCNTYGPAWHNRFENTYISTPENIMVIYWPQVPGWCQNAVPEFNLQEQEYVYIANSIHNPSRETAWTGLYYDHLANRWMVSGVTPLYSGDKQIATVGHDIVLEQLLKRTVEDHLEHACNIIFREDGRLIAHPEWMEEILAKEGYFDIMESGDEHLQTLFRLTKQLEPGKVVTYNDVHAEYLAVTRIRGPDWYFLTVYPKSIIAERAWSTARLILLLGGLSLVIEVGILFFILRKQIAIPLTGFVDATEQIASGDLNIHLDESREDELGRLANSFSAMRDAIREHIARLKKAHDELEAKVIERTAELARAKDAALEAQRAAEAANQAKSTFLANMSHELRTPLNAVLGYAQILRRRRQLDPLILADSLSGIQQGGEHLLTLINDILDISKIEAGKLELYPTQIHFPAFLQGIAEIIHLRAEQKYLTFTYEASPSLPEGIEADETRLRQVLLNLLGNAVKFTKEGRVRFVVRHGAERSAVEGVEERHSASSVPYYEHIYFEVCDTGIGIRPEDLETIFMPFEQAGDDIRNRAEGTGLGLVISQQLVSMMGGELRVKSAVGQGSTFWFELTLPVVSPAEEEMSVRYEDIAGYNAPGRGKENPLKVLIVDDKRDNRMILLNMLSPLGFDITLAENGREGVRKAQETQPDAILMDLVMPVMTGFEAVQEIRRIPALHKTVIFAVSASAFEMEQVKSRVVGCDAFLAKPVKLEKLLNALETHLKLTWIYAEPEEGPQEQQAEDTTRGRPEEPLIPPPLEEMEKLYELAMLGSMRHILERADYLEALDERYRPFAETLRRLARNFAEKEILALVEQYMESGAMS